jgi:hypothetical protein
LPGALSVDEKIRQKAALFWFGLRGCCNILLTSRNPKNNIIDFPALLEHGSAEKIAVCAHTHRDPNKQEDGFIFE